MKRWLTVLVVGAAACGAGVEPGAGPAPMTRGAEPRVQQAPQDRALVPPGHGTLHQDDFTVTLRADALLIKVTPLDESVIRLAAPDTYNRLHALAESRRAEAANATGTDSPQLFLVSFFSYQPDVPFQPEDLQLVHQGRLLQARTILPLAPGWGRQRLQQQETQAAVYAFDSRIDYLQPIVVRYGLTESGGWAQIIPRLEVERAKVQSRAGS
ncbi:MAG TPA: hypothetical protein VKZ58_11010 [Longimicrobiales bacterium]|nr:hypothetical protein [Longimicrobiales bacterium]